MSLTGRWEGKLLDASGPTARLVVDLSETGGSLKGHYAATFLSEDLTGCGDAAEQVAQEGDVAGTVKGDQVVLDQQLEIGGKPVRVRIDCRLSEADPHALQALAGCFNVEEGGDQLTLEGGGCVLWLYANGAAVPKGTKPVTHAAATKKPQPAKSGRAR
jgi:hypothetical protein